MDRNEFKHRRADKVPLDQAKKQLWAHIQKKAHPKPSWYGGFLNFFSGHKFSFVGGLAIILVLAVVSYNFNLPFLKPEPVHASFEMIANEQDSTGISIDSSFTLKASQDLSARTIEANLQVEPQIELKVKETAEGQYQITPEEELEPNQIYHFSIQSTLNGKPQEFTWAYQVKDTFKIMGTTPNDRGTDVPLDTAIDIRFSHENFDFERAKDHFKISPPASGRFEKHQKTLSFVPENPFEKATLYTVQFKKGFPLNNSQQTLAEDYQFQFETLHDSYNDSFSDTHFQQAAYEMAENKTMAFIVSSNSDQEQKIPLKIYQFSGQEDYLEVLKKQAEVPLWASYTQRSANQIDKTRLKEVGEFEAIYNRAQWQGYIYLPDVQLPKGYYLFELPGRNSQAMVQVTNLSAFVEMTDTKSLVWVNDLGSGKPISKAEISFGEEDLAKTDDQGMAVFDTPSTLVEGELTYPKILKITQGEESLFHLINYTYGNSSQVEQYWSSFSTDRPVYLPNDTVKFWGFLKPKNKEADLENLSLQLTSSEGTVLDEKELQLSETDTFINEFKINQFPSGSYYLKVYGGEELILEDYIEVQRYQKPAYQIKLDSKQTAAFVGDEMEFEAAAEFFDGTPVSNLKLNHSDNWNQKSVSTDLQGKLSLKVTAQPPSDSDCSDDCSNEQYYNLTLSPELAEMTDISGATYVRIFNSNIALKTTVSVEGNRAKLDIASHWIDLKQFEETGDHWGNSAPDRNIQGKLIEVTSEKEETGEYYDFINKKVEKKYQSHQVEKTVGNFELNTNNKGQGLYEFEMNPSSFYKVLLFTKDGQGRPAYETAYVYGDLSNPYDYYNIELLHEDHVQQAFDHPNAPYKVGETVLARFSNGKVPFPENQEGQFLFMEFQEGLQSYKIHDRPRFQFEFQEEDIPNTIISGAWFTGENYVIAYEATANYEKEEKRLSVEITPNKTSYQPGESVELEVVVKDKNSEPVEAEVNLNLVDEAYYEAVYGLFIDPLEDLYRFVSSGEIYEYDTHRNPLQINTGGDKGGCFVAGTRILMADGTYKNIEDIKAGDLILTKKTPYSSEMVRANVLSHVSHQVNEYYVINEDLKVTKEHIVFVNGQFKPVIEIKVGDQLLHKNQAWVTVQTIREVKEPVMVYNFQVEDQHTYFANDFYVHNEKSGGIARTDFEDNALFQTISTDSDGKGKVSFKLPDNITSWRVTAKAIDSENLQAGTGSGSIPVSLPLFADLIMNEEYSWKDQPILKFRAYGEALKEKEKVAFALSSKAMDVKSEPIEGRAFEGSYLELPTLTLGQNKVLLEATSQKFKDALEKSFWVVNSRLSKNIIETLPNIKGQMQLNLKAQGPIEATLVDKGRAQYFSDLLNLYYTDGERVDQKLTRLGAQELIQTYFQEQLPTISFDGLTHQTPEGGLKILPYSDPDLEMTVLALLMDAEPERFNEVRLKQYFYDIYQNKEANLDEIILALTGLAALDEPVLTSLKLIENEKTLTLNHHFYLGLSYLALGDKPSAQTTYQKWIKDFENEIANSETKALAAILGARLNVAEVDNIWSAALKEKRPDQFFGLYELGYYKARLATAESQPVQFRIHRNGKSETIDLKKGQVHSSLFLADDQVTIETLKGQLGGTLKYTQPTSIADFKSTEGLKIERSYSTLGREGTEIFEGDIVKINLTLSANESVPKEVFRIEDILPSGLTPISPTTTNFYAQAFDRPYTIEGQTVSFYWQPEPPQIEQNEALEVTVDGIPIDQSPPPPFSATANFSYLARVVNPGKFYADPAKIEASENPTLSSLSQEAWVEIKKAVD